jgi:hypothetical protein
MVQVKQVQNRGNKFGIVAGRAILARFKTQEIAEKHLAENRSLYEYWSGSVSVSVQNSEKRVVNC